MAHSIPMGTHALAQADGCPGTHTPVVPAHRLSEDGAALRCGHPLAMYEVIPGTAGSFCRGCVPALLAEDLAAAVAVAAPRHIITTTRRDVLAAIHAAFDGGALRVCLDLAETTVIDSSGWGVLVRARREAEMAGRRFWLTNASENVRAGMELLRLEHLLAAGDA